MASDEITKHTLNLRAGDFQRLQDFYPRLGAGPVIRRLVQAHVEKLEEKFGQPEVEVEVPGE